MTSEEYRTYLVECVKTLGQMIKDNAEDIVGEMDAITGLTLSAEFDQDFYGSIPELTIKRHHLLSRCPDDVDLLDVIEMIVDCVCAGKARSGEVRPLEISDDILRLAVENTVKLVDNLTEVEEKGETE